MQKMVSFKKGDIVRVTVERLAFEGPGVARVDAGVDEEGKIRRLVLFIEGVAPGDEVEAEILSLKRGLARARVKRFVRMSPARVTPRCPHFGQRVAEDGTVLPFLQTREIDGVTVNVPDLEVNCGGCTWQFLNYEDQLTVKNDLVKDALVRIGSFDPAELDKVWHPIMSSDEPWNYRNKMDFSLVRERDGSPHLGLHMKGRYRDVTEIKSCDLFRPWTGPFLEEMRGLLLRAELEGEIQSLMVRVGRNTGEVMVNLIVENCEMTELFTTFSATVQKFFSSNVDDKLASVYVTKITNKKGQRKRFDEILLWGAPTFREELNVANRKLKFEVAPGAFLQPNTKQAEKFYSLVRELAGLRGQERVLDLFCGTGTIGICLADRAQSITGLELNEQAVLNARENAKLNQVENIDFVVGDAAKVLPELAGNQDKTAATQYTALSDGRTSQGDGIDLIVVDPPRAGLTSGIIETICGTKAPKLIYVSCNPATLARDLKIFAARGWRLKFVQPIDQFSQTYHVETVTMLER